MVKDINLSVIDKLFEDNPNMLVKHQLDSYNNFFNVDIKNIFREKNPIRIMKIKDKYNDYNLKCNLYLGGKEGDKLYYGKPIIYRRLWVNIQNWQKQMLEENIRLKSKGQNPKLNPLHCQNLQVV